MEAQYDEFFRANFRLLVRVVMQHGARIGEAEDAAAQAALEVLLRWADIRDPFAYAVEVARNSYYKARMRDDERVKRTIAAQRLIQQPHGDVRLDSHGERDRVMGLLAALPAAQSEVMACAVDGFSPTETAGFLGKTPEAVRANLRHARKRLAARIQEDPEWMAPQPISPQDERRTDE